MTTNKAFLHELTERLRNSFGNGCRPIIREALRILEIQGFVTIQQG
jgi:DNA-binding FadR family transcriptional regulator